MTSERSVFWEREEKAVFDEEDATEGGGMTSCRFFLGGVLSSPEHAASLSESSPHLSGVCDVSSIRIGSFGALTRSSCTQLSNSSSTCCSLSMASMDVFSLFLSSSILPSMDLSLLLPLLWLCSELLSGFFMAVVLSMEELPPCGFALGLHRQVLSVAGGLDFTGILAVNHGL